jgi:hypothetical protein
MTELDEERFNFITTGWLRMLPEPAMNAYLQMWGSTLDGGALHGELDELGAEALDLASLGGLDTPYDPAHADADLQDDEAPVWTPRWELFVSAAAQRGLPMHTARDAIMLMRAIGLIERAEIAGEIVWRAVIPVPLAEDLLDLDDATRRREADLRWQRAFQHAEHTVTGWLVGQRTDAPTSELTITLTELAGRLGLDVDETRHGLANAPTTSGDITATPDPEVAEADQPLRITVDWAIFDAERIALRFGSPDEDGAQ